MTSDSRSHTLIDDLGAYLLAMSSSVAIPGDFRQGTILAPTGLRVQTGLGPSGAEVLEATEKNQTKLHMRVVEPSIGIAEEKHPSF
jgi:hypothetical protein